MARDRVGRRGAEVDGRTLGALDAVPVAGRTIDSVHGPRRAASRGVFDGGRWWSGATHDVARARCDGAGMDVRGTYPFRHDVRTAVLPQLPGLHARPRRRHA